MLTLGLDVHACEGANIYKNKLNENTKQENKRNICIQCYIIRFPKGQKKYKSINKSCKIPQFEHCCERIMIEVVRFNFETKGLFWTKRALGCDFGIIQNCWRSITVKFAIVYANFELRLN